MKTGKLSGFRVADDIPKGRGLIIDDLCDKGGSFLGLAGLFDNELGLYTTHGLYNNGLEDINEVFAKTFCTNSYHQNLEDIEGFDENKNKVYEATK